MKEGVLAMPMDGFTLSYMRRELLAALQAIRVLAPPGSMMRVDADAAIAKATGMSSNA